MPHTTSIGAAAASTSSSPTTARVRPPIRMSSGSFHAGAPIPSIGSYSGDTSSPRSPRAPRRHPSDSPRYHTFPTAPPKTPRENDRSFEDMFTSDDNSASESESEDDEDDDGVTPLPLKQLGLLALLSLAEQTALNSISPYLPTMVRSFPDIAESQTGLYVGLLASAFALAQLATNLIWGALCDRIGRKPVLLLGTTLLAACFSLFGLCTKYWHIVLVHVAMGLLNGNAAVVPTCLGELTDRSNQSRAFTWLPLMYSIGGITGPALGGLLVPEDISDYTFPFLYPNVASAVLLVIAVVVLGIWFEETLEDFDTDVGFPGASYVRWLREKLRPRRADRGRVGSWSSRWPTRGQRAVAGNYDEESDEESGDESSPNARSGSSSEEQTLLGSPNPGASEDGKSGSGSSHKSIFRQLLNRRTVLVLATYLVFQLSNISFNSLYPIFASAPEPTGRDLSPETIGLLMSFAGFVTIGFQLSIFQKLKARMGNLRSYQYAVMGLAISMALMPWVGIGGDENPPFGIGSADGWLYGEIGAVLVIKNICAVGGLSSVMLLITNSAPSHETLGTLNGIAQTLSAAGRSVGPFLSGGLFTLSTQVRPRGEVLAWGLFAGIAVVGWLGSLTIRGDGLESADWVGDGDENEATEPEP